MQDKETIGFIGIGIMGRSMAGHLQRAGYPLHVHNRTRAKAEELIDRGAIWHGSVASLARACDIVITMVGYPADVESVYLGAEGILAHARQGACAIDMTTSSPALAKKIWEAAKKKGIVALDAPVTGGDLGARDAKLSIMVGGERAAFDAMKAVFGVMGTTVVYQGPAGAGQHAKLANQIAIAGCIMGVCESLAYAECVGLDRRTLLESIENGAAGSRQLSVLGPRMIDGDFAPGFYVKHFVKDLGIAIDVAREMGIELPALALAKSLYERVSAGGLQDAGTQALYRLYVDRNAAP